MAEPWLRKLPIWLWPVESKVAECYVCRRPWVEESTLCDEGVCSEQCKEEHQAWCTWCAAIHFNNDPRIKPIKELHEEGKV